MEANVLVVAALLVLVATAVVVLVVAVAEEVHPRLLGSQLRLSGPWVWAWGCQALWAGVEWWLGPPQRLQMLGEAPWDLCPHVPQSRTTTPTPLPCTKMSSTTLPRCVPGMGCLGLIYTTSVPKGEMYTRVLACSKVHCRGRGKHTMMREVVGTHDKGAPLQGLERPLGQRHRVLAVPVPVEEILCG